MAPDDGEVAIEALVAEAGKKTFDGAIERRPGRRPSVLYELRLDALDLALHARELFGRQGRRLELTLLAFAGRLADPSIGIEID